MTILKSKWLILLIIAGIGWLSLSLIKVKLQDGAVNREIRDLQSKVEDLEGENVALGKFLESINDPSFIEKEARLKLNYKAVDEEVAFIYPDNSPESDLVVGSFQSKLAQMPNYLKWVYYLLGY